MKKNNNYFLILILILLIIGGEGCYQRFWEKTNETYYQPDKNSLIGYKSVFNFIKYPDYNNPYLSFEIIRFPIYKNFKVTKYVEAEKLSNRNTSIVLSVLSFLGNLVIYSVEASKEDFTKPSYIFYSSLIPTGLFVLYFLISSDLDEKASVKYKSNYKYSYELDTLTSVDSIRLDWKSSNYKVNIKIDEIEKSYYCNDICKINLIEDFGLLSFDTLMNIKTKVEAFVNQNITIDTIIYLNPHEWTKEFIKIDKDSVPAYYITKENELILVKYLRKDENYEIFYKGTELDEIICDSIITKIEKGVGKYFWQKK